MKTLVINGSPNGENSSSLKLARAFLSGAEKSAREPEITVLNISELAIKPCAGCFGCWKKTPGKCGIKDDMPSVLEKIMGAELIVWSFPLYYFSVPGGLKNLIDRQLPLNLPFMTGQANGGHPLRYDASGQRHVVISTCGFHTADENYAAVDAMFTRYYGSFGRIYCGQGELFKIPELKKRTDEYLETVKQAGAEYPNITAETRNALNMPLFPKDVFEKMADASWGVEKNEHGEETADESLLFTRQMAALYNKSNYDKDRVLEMRYTDIGKSYQIILTKDGSEVRADNFAEHNTVIETPYVLWKSVAAGETVGSAALAEGKYRVLGDFSMMLKWDDLFGAGIPKAYEMVSCFVKLASRINGANIAGAAMGIAFLISGANGWFFAGLEIVFALFWGVTVFLKVPMSCYFSAASYGGEKMLNNPLFVRTNRILTACWASLYLLLAAGFVLCKFYSVPMWLAGAGSYVPALLHGAFTAWFQKWYPAKTARGK